MFQNYQKIACGKKSPGLACLTINTFTFPGGVKLVPLVIIPKLEKESFLIDCIAKYNENRTHIYSPVALINTDTNIF